MTEQALGAAVPKKNVNDELNLSEIFNCSDLLIGTMQAPTSDGASFIPQINASYVFTKDALNEILLYLAHPLNDCLYISGPSGCGKTSQVLQVAARLNWGVEQLTLSNKTESMELIGHMNLRNGRLEFEYGPLARAMKYGEILILNEIDLMAPGDLSALNDVLEGKPLTVVANNGEVIMPHPFFRVIATANTKGNGDSVGFYNGARLLNQAFLDRWRFLEMSYPYPKAELSIIRSCCPSIDEALAKELVRFAGELRRVSLGDPEADDSAESQLSAPFTTRTLIRIATLMSISSRISVQQAVSIAYAMRLPKVEREYVLRLCNDVFGHAAGTSENTDGDKQSSSGAEDSAAGLSEDLDAAGKVARAKRKSSVKKKAE
ncbi:MAG TPA: CbbQ/NirQ/NorQ/GpvN family protein [Succinivibrionaceae bacterium]|nr:CbbQ/NirQ/NorQ/GpvN family protein [Succinivibrionaceae bacterium]